MKEDWVYVPVKSMEDGLAISEAAYKLCMPDHVRDPDNVTSRVGTVIKHPDRDEWMWRVYEKDLRLHPEADPDDIIPVIQAGSKATLPTQALNGVRTAIINRLGSNSKIDSYLPPQMWNARKTGLELSDDGWFGPSTTSTPGNSGKAKK